MHQSLTLALVILLVIVFVLVAFLELAKCRPTDSCSKLFDADQNGVRSGYYQRVHAVNQHFVQVDNYANVVPYRFVCDSGEALVQGPSQAACYSWEGGHYKRTDPLPNCHQDM